MSSSAVATATAATLYEQDDFDPNYFPCCFSYVEVQVGLIGDHQTPVRR